MQARIGNLLTKNQMVRHVKMKGVQMLKRKI